MGLWSGPTRRRLQTVLVGRCKRPKKGPSSGCAASVKQIFNIMSMGPNCPFYWVDTSDARQCAVGPLICCQSTNVIVIIVKRNHCTKHVFETPFHEALFILRSLSLKMKKLLVYMVIKIVEERLK